MRPLASSAASAAASETTRSDDDGLLTSRRDGVRLFRVYTVGEGQKPVAHEVTIGISNTRFTEMISGPLKAGDALITRRADGPGDKK